MKPIMLHGHERAITQIRYNKDGDLLLSCSKDPTPNIWYSLTGERLGTFDGHNGAVWSIDVNWDTTKVVTGAADNTCRIWDPSNGKLLDIIETQTAVRCVNFSYSGKLVLYTTDKSMGRQCEMNIVDLNDSSQKPASILNITITGPKISSTLWGPFDQSIITGHDNGDIILWDIRTGKKLQVVQEHKDVINDLQYSKDETMFITASKDHTAKLFDTSSLKPFKVYKTERPVNSAAISPIMDHVIVAGGQEAMDVTTTSARQGKFDARFFHLIFEEEFGRVKDHFGPINSVAFHPDGKSYSSGGEDGYVRTHTFDPTYFEFDFEY